MTATIQVCRVVGRLSALCSACLLVPAVSAHAQSAPPQTPTVAPAPAAPSKPGTAQPPPAPHTLNAVPATGPAPQTAAGQPTHTAAAQSAPASAPPAGTPVVSGGGDAPHGALAMDRQLAMANGWTGAQPKVQRPSWVSPAFWSALLPKDNAQPTEQQVALGRSLYFEPRLSRDGTVACATCHDTSRGFTDRRNLFEGVGGSVGRRNSPTTMNALFFSTMFWDGRAPTLEEQAKLPIINPIEMGQPNPAAAVAALASDAQYQQAFQTAYGRPVNYDDIGRALASYERTLIFLSSPFDRWALGDAKAISDDAKAGWSLYNGKGRCSACHQISSSNPIGTDGRFHNVGVSARHQDFEGLAKRALAVLEKDSSSKAIDELALQTDLAELGRFTVTRNRSDIGSFKTSQVRNVGVTAPYMHDGSLQTLWDVMDHYNKGGEANPYLDGGIEPLALSETEVNQLVAFLFTLTDERLADQNRAEWDRQRSLASQKRPFRDDALATRKLLQFERRAQAQR
jgi:cytochrome c peroxidase